MHFVGKVLATREEVLQAEQVSNHGGYVITNVGPRLFPDRSKTSMLCKYGELAIYVQRCLKKHTSFR